MKTINVTFEDEDFDNLMEIKGKDKSWREFILSIITPANKKGGEL